VENCKKLKRINKYDAKRQRSPGSALLLILHRAIEQRHLKYPYYDAETREDLARFMLRKAFT
jgi:hypothetical protein